jgi:hypothetical protein
MISLNTMTFANTNKNHSKTHKHWKLKPMIIKFFQYFLYKKFVRYFLQKPKYLFLSLSNDIQHWITLNHKHNIPPKENIILTLNFCC